MLESQIEVKFTVHLTEIPEEHRLAAQRKAHEALSNFCQCVNPRNDSFAINVIQ